MPGLSKLSRDLKKMRKIILAILLLGSTNSLALGPSFDCDKSSNVSEKLICNNTELSELDYKLNLMYRSVFNNTDSADALKFGQIDWVKKRNECSADSCIRISYMERISFLFDMAKQISRQNSKLWNKEKCIADPFLDLVYDTRSLGNLKFKIMDLNIHSAEDEIKTRHSLYSNCLTSQDLESGNGYCNWSIYEEVNDCYRPILGNAKGTSFGKKDGFRIIDELPAHMPVPKTSFRNSVFNYKYLEVVTLEECKDKRGSYRDPGVSKSTEYWAYIPSIDKYQRFAHEFYSFCSALRQKRK